MSKHASLVICLRNTNKSTENQEILLVCDETKTPHDLKPSLRWGLPGGKCCNNKLKTGNCCPELHNETAIREMFEKTGYKVTVELIFSDELLHPETREKYMRYVFSGRIIGGKQLANKPSLAPIRPAQVSISECAQTIISPKWFELSAFPKNSHWSHQQIIKRYFGVEVK